MNRTARTTLITLATTFAALAGVGSALASEASQDFNTPMTSNRTRADVRSEAIAAERAGMVQSGEVSWAATPASTESRAVVKAEAREAMRLGLLNSDDVDTYTATPAQQESIHMAGLRARNANAR